MIEQADLWSTVTHKDRFVGAWQRLLTVWQNILNRCQNYGALEYYSPNVNGFSHQILDTTGTLVMDPAAAYATGTLTLAAKPFDGLEQKILSTQAVAALTIGAGSYTVLGAPAGIAAGGVVGFTFRQASTTWYRST